MAKQKSKKIETGVSSIADVVEEVKENNVEVAEESESVKEDATNDGENEYDTDKTEESGAVAEEKEEVAAEPVVESVTVVEPALESNSFARFVKPVTKEERDLCDLIDKYIEISYRKETSVKDAENKLALLVKILSFPYSSGVSDQTVMFNIVRTFFTKERKFCLAEAYVSQKAHMMGEIQFKEFINVYTAYITLVDCKENKKKFRLQLNTLLTILGVKYQSFVNWLQIESEKINKVVANS